MKRIIKSLLICGCTAVLIILTGCEHSKAQNVQKADEQVHIPMILTVDPSTGRKNEENVVVAFNQAYKGIYHIDAKWEVETEEEYRKNLKRMNVTDTLPAVITDLRLLPSFYQMMIQDHRIEDLTYYLDEDNEWKNMIEPSVLESYKEDDGKIYCGPVSTSAFSCSGIFWNQELFEKAGISHFPRTWDEFWECCEKLKAHGITPLALHTEGTAWAPMLLATANAADTPEGAAFMKELYPESYNNECGLKIASTLKRLFAYTTEDALHGDFDVAYDNFFSGKAAMIPNGYWMLDQIPKEWRSRVRFSAFPGNKLISSPETFGWGVVASYSEEVKKGAIAFLKFRTQLNKKKKETLFSLNPNNLSQAEQDYIAAYQSSPQIVPNYQVKWNSVLQEETLGEYLPELVQGKLTPREFVEKEDESVLAFKKEQ